jgi:hypothetical protein
MAKSIDPVTVKMLSYIAEKAENCGLKAEDVLAGMVWRRVRLAAAKIVVTEDDEVCSAVSELYRKND